jgi:hypothetical protein
MKFKLPFCAFVILLVGHSLLADTNNTTVTLPELRQRVEAATLPTQSYFATVHQTIWQMSPTAALGAPALSTQTNKLEEADYEVHCAPTGELHAKKGLLLTRKPSSLNTQSTALPSAHNARLLITINPINSLRHIATLNSLIISDDIYQNIPCYKLSALDDHFGFVIWVTKADSYVCRQIILQDSNPLFDAQFEYKRWGGRFVPLRTMITKPSNGARVIQDFSGHTF